MYAQVAAMYIKAYSKLTYKEAERMESHVPSFNFLDCFDITGTGSHKYIPADKLSADLGYPSGSGVYNYARFSDGSYLLYTCEGPVAYWSGKQEDKAEFPTLRSELAG